MHSIFRWVWRGADVPEYDAAKTIGMAAVLAVNLRGLPEIQYGTLRLVASRLFHIRSDVLDTVLRTLADLRLIKLVTTGGTIQQVIPDVPHFEDVYTQVGEYTDAKLNLHCAIPAPRPQTFSISDGSQRYNSPPSTPPTIGASQNNHNCPSAQPPTNKAGPVLRAGLTDVFVTGMLIR